MSHRSAVLAMHRAIAPDPHGQVCWSPFSVTSALGLLAHGAGGASRAELLALLGDVGELTRLLTAAAVLDEHHDVEDQQPVIAVSNTLWADESIEIEKSFASEVTSWPGGSVRNAPFRAEPEKARGAINQDVADTTRQLIPKLLPPGVIGPSTVSALVNALYLKCAWRYRFPDRATAPRPFHAPGGAVDVPTMALNERIGYATMDGWRVVVLPAVGGVDAVVLLPDGDLAEAEPNLTGDSLAALLAAPRPTQVSLRLPKLRLRSAVELTAPLRAVGVRTVFTDDADLRAISPDPLAVGQVLHESVLKVDEQGFEGAAATAILIRATSMPPEPVQVTVDRPFLLLVRHAHTGAVYFLARVMDPS